MAVDANVLIFERIKEELKDETNNILAFDGGYTKSRTAILDANITTLLAAIILFFEFNNVIFFVTKIFHRYIAKIHLVKTISN
jgi:preprotein translocase subunit SecF